MAGSSSEWTDMENRFSITDYFLSEHDHLILKSLLVLVGDQTGAEWVYQENTDNKNNLDVVIIDMDSENADKLLPELENIKAIRVGMSNSPQDRIDLVIPKPIRAKDLIDILKRSMDKLNIQPLAGQGGQSKAATAKNTGEHPSAVLQFLSEQRRGHQNQSWTISLGETRMNIDYQNNLASFTDDSKDLATFANAGKNDIKIENTNIRLSTNDRNKPVNTLAWYTAVYGSQSTLLPQISETMSFKLRRWPDLRLLKQRSELTRPAALISKNWRDINQLIKFTKLNREEIIAFINACYLCELLLTENKEADLAPENSKPSAPESLFSKLRKKLGIGDGEQ